MCLKKTVKRLLSQQIRWHRQKCEFSSLNIFRTVKLFQIQFNISLHRFDYSLMLGRNFCQENNKRDSMIENNESTIDDIHRRPSGVPYSKSSRTADTDESVLLCDSVSNFNELPIQPPSRFVTGGYWQILSSYQSWQFGRWPAALSNPSSGDMIATLQGYVSVIVHNDIRIDITVDRAIRLVNNRVNMKLSITPSGKISALLSPTGRMYQYGSRVETIGFDKSRTNNKYAKMWHGGISFTSDSSALVFLLDEGGTRSTTDKFCDLISYDFSKSVFFAESLHGPQYVDECLTLLNTARYTVKNNGDEKWIINGIKIEQNADGFVKVSRDKNRIQMKTSLKGTSGITTPFVHCTASVGIQDEPKHLFVRRGERRMHYDGEIFVVRNGGHSAGFDSCNKLTVF